MVSLSPSWPWRTMAARLHRPARTMRLSVRRLTHSLSHSAPITDQLHNLNNLDPSSFKASRSTPSNSRAQRSRLPKARPGRRASGACTVGRDVEDKSSCVHARRDSGMWSMRGQRLSRGIGERAEAYAICRGVWHRAVKQRRCEFQ
ncbi:hypothetical protein C2E23DRAFT_135480 [Lenzites betulinus]|nr:hypothetical protein C2E23DRAFT_135480 [Lenzites betulinus]